MCEADRKLSHERKLKMKKYTGIIGGPVNQLVTYHVTFEWDKETAPVKQDLVEKFETGSVEILETVVEQPGVGTYKKEYTTLGITGEVRNTPATNGQAQAIPVAAQADSNGEAVVQ
jgi:hypothetical protein